VGNYRKYAPLVKERALQLYKDGELSLLEISKELDIKYSVLNYWMKYQVPKPTSDIIRCPKCKLELVPEQFSRNKLKKSGRDSYCKKCVAEKKITNVQKPCLYCGKLFFVKKHSNGSITEFCSVECRSKAFTKPTGITYWHCNNCDKLIKLNRNQLSKRRVSLQNQFFCDRFCFNQWQTKRRGII
jgi:transposase-like protein